MTGLELKLWRTGLGWTQERAAEEFGISMRTYIRYEQSKPAPFPLETQQNPGGLCRL
ncbi:helix-turn-helix transcriptional regulator [Serratia sp. N21D137]|uniref:helix-turn-helix transcriptional regulator n=1 Tax=Serratia sp. N21D137 TaxID=3397495 RepID=UPI0039E1B2D8